MKNNPAPPPKSSALKQRVVAMVVIVVVALAGSMMFLLKATNHKGELQMAIQSRDHAGLEKLLKDHPGLVEAELPHRGPKDTWSPLHLAACSGDAESIEILTRHRARVTARDANGLTPLHYTVSLSHYDSAQMLINHGADINAKGRDGRTPLDLAKNLRDQKLIEMFRIRGAKE